MPYKELSRGRLAVVLTAWAILFLAGAWLLLDSATYSLRPADPSTGRDRGCYTQLDLLLGLGASEGSVFRGTRLVEFVLGVAATVVGIVLFFRRLWRSPFEVPLIAAAALWGIWLAGQAFFWRFHDTDVYLTWRIIGNTPNALAKNITALAVLAINCLAIWLLRGDSIQARENVSRRLIVYLALLSYPIAFILLMVPFGSTLTLLMFAVPALFVSAIAASIQHFRAATVRVSSSPVTKAR
jgi:hypothetical protein